MMVWNAERLEGSGFKNAAMAVLVGTAQQLSNFV
jgi:hypothetical protein